MGMGEQKGFTQLLCSERRRQLWHRRAYRAEITAPELETDGHSQAAKESQHSVLAEEL